MSQIFDRVFLCKFLNKEDYLKKHQEIVSSILSTQKILFKSLSEKDYLKAHETVVEHILKNNSCLAKNEANYLGEHKKAIYEISYNAPLPYPVDEYLNVHGKVFDLLKNSFNNWKLQFDLSSDKYLCVSGKIMDVTSEISLDGYKLLFKPLDKNEYFNIHNGLVSKIKQEMNNLKIIKLSDIYLEHVNEKTSLIRDIISRVEKRKVYFHLFHNGLEMGELNEIALYCFWILKLQPFRYKGTSTAKVNANEINLLITIHLFKAVVKKTAEKLYDEKKRASRDCNPSEDFLRNLKYSFKYHDLSKEAIMTLASGLLADSTGSGPAV